MSVSLRPLPVEELDKFDITTPMLDDKPFSEYSTVREACSKLITVISPGPSREPLNNSGAREGTIRLTHPSLRYYLFSYQIGDTLGPWSVFSSDEGENNSSMADTCLESLLGHADHPPPDQPLREKHTLPSYAAEFWFMHARDLVVSDYPKENASQSTLTKLFTPERMPHLAMIQLFTSEQHFSLWLSMYDPDTGAPRLHGDHPSPLYHAALLGFPQLVDYLLSQGFNVNQAGGTYQYPLLAAIHTFSHAETRVCMDQRARIYTQYKVEYESLEVSRLLARQRTVALLLENGADPNARYKHGYTALHWAVRQEFGEISLALIESGADLDAKEPNGRTALLTTVEGDRSDILQMLITAGANVSVSDPHHLTLLVYATRKHGAQKHAASARSQGGHRSQRQFWHDCNSPCSEVAAYRRSKASDSFWRKHRSARPRWPDTTLLRDQADET